MQKQKRTKYNENLIQIIKQLGIEDIDISLMEKALTHYSFKIVSGINENYESLEFIGDAVIYLVSALVHSEENYPVYLRSQLRERTVTNQYLSKFFDLLNLNQVIRISPFTLLGEKIKADVIEAIFGAVFFHYGIEKCRLVWERIHTEFQMNFKINKARHLFNTYCRENNIRQPKVIVLKSLKNGNTEHVLGIEPKLFPNGLTLIASAKGSSINEAYVKLFEKICKCLNLNYKTN